MLDAIITSKLRVKLLLKFFINPETTAWLRGLEKEFGVSSNAVRQELNKLEEAGIIKSESSSYRKLFRANDQHPLYEEIRRIMMKTAGIEQILEKVIRRLGDPQKVYLTGSLARGVDSDRIQLCIVGEIDRDYLDQLTRKAEQLINKTITTTIIHPDNWTPAAIEAEPGLLIYSGEGGVAE